MGAESGEGLAVTPWEGLPWGPRKWQAEALPLVIAAIRRRVRALVVAVMGAGKSTFLTELVRCALPKLAGRAVVVLAPSVRLVEQLAETLRGRLGDETVGVFYGKKKQPERPVVVCCYPSLGKLRAALGEVGRKVALVVVDEAHKAEAPGVKAELAALNPPALVGLTATAFRSVPEELLTVFDAVVYRYPLLQAIADGVLVPPEVIDWDGPRGVTPDDAVLSMIQRHTAGPGIVSAHNIEDAEEYAEWLTERGVPALAIHSKMSPKAQAKVVALLKNGTVRALVHVALLAEGVDFPWLRWICYRVPLMARVRFLQKAGRVLRSHPGKTRGVILDPLCLFGVHGWTSPEAIGDALDQVAAAEAEESPLDADGIDRSPKEGEAVALDALLRHFVLVYGGLAGAGFCPAIEDVGAGWRLAGVTDAQVRQLGKLSFLTRHVAKPYRETLKGLAKVPFALTRGQAEMLLDVLRAGRRWAREWVAEHPDEGLEMFRVQWPAELVPDSVPFADVLAGRLVAKWGKRVRARERRAGL